MAVMETPEDKAVRNYVTSNNTIRLQKPKHKKRRPPKKKIVATTEVVTTGFVEFLRKNGVVALAVGFVIATQVQVLAKQLITSFIDPLFTLIFGSKLSTKTFTVTVGGDTAVFAWGTFVYGLINFLFVVLCLYLIIKIFKLDHLDKQDEEK